MHTIVINPLPLLNNKPRARAPSCPGCGEGEGLRASRLPRGPAPQQHEQEAALLLYPHPLAEILDKGCSTRIR